MKILLEENKAHSLKSEIEKSIITTRKWTKDNKLILNENKTVILPVKNDLEENIILLKIKIFFFEVFLSRDCIIYVFHI